MSLKEWTSHEPWKYSKYQHQHDRNMSADIKGMLMSAAEVEKVTAKSTLRGAAASTPKGKLRPRRLSPSRRLGFLEWLLPLLVQVLVAGPSSASSLFTSRI